MVSRRTAMAPRPAAALPRSRCSTDRLRLVVGGVTDQRDRGAHLGARPLERLVPGLPGARFEIRAGRHRRGLGAERRTKAFRRRGHDLRLAGASARSP